MEMVCKGRLSYSDFELVIYFHVPNSIICAGSHKSYIKIRSYIYE